ncbi:aminoacetone oxidase family FAD-binding enzyme [Aliarcobacter skirrowii]|uniref:Aminoacetone oxidase family FAD-binding enzyme n=1 Tax=Aliarcobacter skirrowii TaxID=28200 RepID=A0A2U2C2K9_9BACT|nr:aminoacetone oxidase family FAD-binding enzyme [Aliarcobacter skirrowii]PWE23267.1 aminoacetone oxidase family FAD-binding enzyme [Aliarcobacter skirrowii]PWE25666.1 aminoacetone oxidase family FAD-binding enzyme [Aliarcobacter skirrowii]RJO56494.1 aminoacetone oxidase family FAD-binding enzyme [Aliarcobacter skirrowii]RJO58448.1 aminoacetone oxidase family FAD-binding enzyme [Aliarcobacter skirrowii]
MYDIAIVGAGASGLMFASNLDKKKFKNICLIDSNDKIGQKIKVSGGAKCNITNEFVSENNYLGDRDFAKDILKRFSKDDLLRFLNKNQLFPKINPKIVKGTYFCNSSQDVIDMFNLLTTHIKKFLSTKVLDISYNNFFTITTSKGIIEAKKVVVASGGLSYASLGASAIAFDIAKKFDHTIVDLNPALVGFTVQKEQFWFKDLSGLSIFVNIFVEDKKIEGNLLFAHKGFSGPAVLSSSLYWKKGKISIDFLPNINIEKLLVGNKNISTALPLPKRFTQEFLKSINLDDKPCSKLDKEEFETLKILKKYSFAPAGNFGYTKAEVTKGGICTDEIDHKTFESLKQKDLYFIGECLDLTGELGGFNFQIVFSQAYLCAKEQNNF